MKYLKIPIYALTAALVTAPTMGFAWDHDDDDEEPFDEARLFFELNDTDGDLGIHGKVDGDEWRYLEIEDPRDRKMMNLWVRGRLRRQGLTELFFESAEPCFPSDEECEDPLDPERFFSRFPEGEYDIEGITLDGEERESEVYLSHVIPAAPDGVTVNGVAIDEDECIAGIDPVDGVVLSWGPVTQSHAAKHGDDGLGEDGVIQVRYYEVVVEIDETDFKTVANLPPEITSWTLPKDFFSLSEEGEYKFELLVRINVHDEDGNPVLLEIDEEEGQPLPGNKSAIESCFEIVEAGL